MERPSTLLAATAAAGVFLTGGLPRSASAEPDTATRAHQLVGARYDTMLALAGYLDDTAQGALEGAADEVRRGSPSGARFLSAIRAFAASTRDLHGALGVRQVTPIELPSQVAELTHRARVLNGRIHAARALESTYEEWEAMAEVLRRMTQLLAGQDVDVPRAYVVPALSGARLAQVRELASDLEVSATRAHDKATRALTAYQERGEQFLGELRHFAGQSRDLHVQADLGQVDPQRVGPLVDQLLEEARQADRRMRNAEVFTEVWDDSARTITILQRMASLLRS
jgi:hypothetical protein